MDSDTNLNRWVALYSLPISLYSLSIVLGWVRVSGYLSALNALIVSMTMLTIYITQRKDGSHSIFFLLASIASFLWGIADVGWAILEYMGIDALENEVLWVIYALPNLLLASGMLFIIVPQMNKWSIGQLATDIITIVLLGSLALWEIFFNKNIELVESLINMDFTSAVSIMLDIILIIGIITWLSGMTKGNIPQYVQLSLLGLCVYAFTDLAYFYKILHGSYVANGLIDLCYGFSFYYISIGSVYWIRDSRRNKKQVVYSNVGNRYRWFVICIIPVTMLAMQLLNLEKIPVDFNMVGLSAGVILLNWWISRYIQLSIENEKLLKQVQLHNDHLENVVSIQNKQLSDGKNIDAMTQLFIPDIFLWNYWIPESKRVAVKRRVA